MVKGVVGDGGCCQEMSSGTFKGNFLMHFFLLLKSVFNFFFYLNLLSSW